MTTGARIGAIVAGLAMSGAVQAQEPAPITAFVSVNLIRMDHDRVEAGQTVVVRHGRIHTIGPTATVTPPDGAVIVDGTGRYLLPGLTDSHVHLTTDMPWAPARADFGDAPLYLAHGVTTVVNLRGTLAQLDWKRRIESGDLVGPTIYTSGEFVNEPRVTSVDEVRREVQAQRRAGYDVIKFHEIWEPESGFATRAGLARDSYLEIFRAAREAGMPVVGHVPMNLGIGGLLAASSGAVAHVGELNRLHFLLGLPTLVATAAAAFVLFMILVSWTASGLVGRHRGRRNIASKTFRRMQVSMAGVLAATVFMLAIGFWVGPGGSRFESGAWRGGGFGAAASLTVLAVLTLAGGIKLFRDGDVPGRSKRRVAIAGLTCGGLALLAALSWMPFFWRTSATGIDQIAGRLREAGIAVQSTLVVSETLAPGTTDRVFADPAFKSLSSPTQVLWRDMAARRGAQSFDAFLMPPRFAEFTQAVAGALHRNAVVLLAGTDAMGLPLIVPGSSLIRELELLARVGLTPFDAIRTATRNPARFLGKEGEFGAVVPGARADLILLDRNPLERVDALREPAGVMVRGRWLPRERLKEMLAPLQ